MVTEWTHFSMETHGATMDPLLYELPWCHKSHFVPLGPMVSQSAICVRWPRDVTVASWFNYVLWDHNGTLVS